MEPNGGKQRLLQYRQCEYRPVDRFDRGGYRGRNSAKRDGTLRECYTKPAMAAASRLLPRRGQRPAGETGSCSCFDRIVLVEGCRSAAGCAADSQEPRRQHGASEAILGTALCECIASRVQQQRLLRGDRCTGLGSGETRQESRDERRTDSAVRRRQLFECPIVVGRTIARAVADRCLRLCEGGNNGVPAGRNDAG